MVSLLNSPPPKCTIFFSGPNLPILCMIPALVPTTLCFTALSHVCHTTGLHFPPYFLVPLFLLLFHFTCSSQPYLQLVFKVERNIQRRNVTLNKNQSKSEKALRYQGTATEKENYGHFSHLILEKSTVGKILKKGNLNSDTIKQSQWKCWNS